VNVDKYDRYIFVSIYENRRMKPVSVTGRSGGGG
jgi:hypothetical protein